MDARRAGRIIARMPILLLVLLLIWSPAAALEDEGADPGAIAPSHAGLAYGQDPRQVLDLWLPPGRTDCPLVIYVHGGGWRLGDRSRVGGKAAWALAQGWAFASVEYRLTPQVRHPAHIQDVAAAVAWLAAKSADYAIAGRRLALLGHSAGAHLVCLLGTDAARRRAAGIPDGAIRAVIGLDGAGYDIAAAIADAKPTAKPMFIEAFGEDPAGWGDASPLSHVAAGGTYPAFLLPYVARRAASGRMAEELARRLRDAGGQASALPVQDSSHAQINRSFGTDGDPPTAAALALLRTAFAKP
jgi:acetyl esterase/lipase